MIAQPAPRMKWTLLPITQFERLASTWDAINGQSGDLPFLHSRFMLPLCEAFGDASLRIALCENAQGPVAMAVLSRKGLARWESFQPSQSPLGAWVMHPDQAFEALLSTLAKSLPGAALVVGVTQQDPNCFPRPTESRSLRTLDYIRTAHVPVGGSFDDYWSQRGKNLRHNMKRQRAALTQDGVATQLEVLTRPEDVAAAIEDYGRLENAGWKAASGTAVSPDNAQGRFYRAMLEAFCRAGKGCIYRYRFGERVVAVDLCIEGGGALVILKTTYDESIKSVSPAFLMRQESFRRLFEEGRVKRIEFYGRVMEWHTRWSSDIRTMYHVNYYRWPIVPGIKGLVAKLRASRNGDAVAEGVKGP
jgi:CelD/BcsL family acetyltransferase involved in cellulose biosynthesis